MTPMTTRIHLSGCRIIANSLIATFSSLSPNQNHPGTGLLEKPTPGKSKRTQNPHPPGSCTSKETSGETTERIQIFFQDITKD